MVQKGVDFDIDLFRKVHLFGIQLRDAQGNEFPDELLKTYLDSSIAQVEKALGVVIQPREEEEFHDFYHSDYSNWGFVKVFRKPVIDVESLEMVYGDRVAFSIPKDWMRIDARSGQIQLFPMSGSTGGMIITGSGQLMMPMMRGGLSYAPQLWKIKYSAGMVEPNPDEPNVLRNHHVHPDLKEAVYKKAAASIMTVWGDLIIGAGIANQTISLDGMSQSVGTTQSAMYGGASARVNQLNEDYERLIIQLKGYYGGLDMVVI